MTSRHSCSSANCSGLLKCFRVNSSDGDSSRFIYSPLSYLTFLHSTMTAEGQVPFISSSLIKFSSPTGSSSSRIYDGSHLLLNFSVAWIVSLKLKRNSGCIATLSLTVDVLNSFRVITPDPFRRIVLRSFDLVKITWGPEPKGAREVIFQGFAAVYPAVESLR